MKIKGPFILLFSFLALSLPAQLSLMDSLRRALHSEKDPLQQLEIRYKLATEMKEHNLDSAALYADTLERMALKTGDLRGQARAMDIRGDILTETGRLTEAMAHYRKALAIFEGMADKKGRAMVLTGISTVFKGLSQADSAIVYMVETARIQEELGRTTELASVYSNIGNLYVDNKLFDKGIEFLLKALDIRKKNKDEKRMIYTLNNLSVAYGTKGDLEPAMDYARQGIDLALKYENIFVAGVISGGMGHLLEEKGDYEEAIRWCRQSIDYLTEAGRRQNLVFPLVNLAMVYNNQKKYAQALQVAKEGFAIMEEFNLLEPLQVYYEEMAKAYEGLGNYQQANFWLRKFMVLDDSLFQAENVRTIAEIETRYETSKKEAEIIRKDLQLSEHESRIFRRGVWIFGLALGLLTFILLGVLYYNRYRLRQKALLDAAVIREQKLGLNAVIQAQEAERKRIAKDLHDGIAQELVAVKLGFTALERKLQRESPEEAGRISDLSRQLDESCTELRNIAHVMLPPTLEQHGLAPSLELLLRNTLQAGGLEVKFDCRELPPQLDDKIELGLYRIAQELVNNIIKHAKAARVLIQLYQAGNNLVLRVEDDGNGFDFETAKNKGSMGLLNILSRVNTLGGAFFTEPGQPRGTVSTVRIPL